MKNNKKLLLIAGIVVALLLIGGGVLLWMVWKSTPAADSPSNSGASKTTTQYNDKQQLINEVNTKYGTNDFKGAITLIEGQKDVEDVSLQLLLAGAYANSGDVKKAFDIYKKIADAGKLPDSELANMADMADRAGDFKAALAAYKKAKEYGVSSKKVSQDEIVTYDYKISELEKKQ